MGRYSVDCFMKTQSLIYEDRLSHVETPSVLKECYSVSKMLHSKGIYSWYTYVNHIRNELNLQEKVCTTNNQQYFNYKANKKCYRRETSNQYEEKFNEKMNNLDQNSKLQLFKLIKGEYTFGNYLHSLNHEYKKLICKFRISDHPLAIEKGRYLKIPRHLRLCNSCDKIEDEYHFLLDCSINQTQRNHLFLSLELEDSLSKADKIRKILNPDSKEQVRLLGSFLKQSLALRTGGQ